MADPPSPLDPQEIEERLRALRRSTGDGWSVDGVVLRREFRFEDFDAAFAFMTRVAALAKGMDHHPNWSNAYDKVVIELTTHDVGGLTSKDFELAEGIDHA